MIHRNCNSNRSSLFWGDGCRPNAAVLSRRDDTYIHTYIL